MAEVYSKALTRVTVAGSIQPLWDWAAVLLFSIRFMRAARSEYGTDSTAFEKDLLKCHPRVCLVRDLHDNPYLRNSLPGREWEKGYWDAVDEDEDRREPDCATLSDRVREPSHYHRLWHPARQYSVPVNRGCRKRRLQTSAAH